MAITDRNFEVNVQKQVEKAKSGDFNNSENGKEKISPTIKKLVSDSEELLELRNKHETLGDKTMDSKDIALFESKINEMLNTKFREMDSKFGNMNERLNDIKHQTDQGCENGKCIENKLGTLEDTITNISDVVSGDRVTNKIDELDNRVSDLGNKLKETCDGVDCINNKMKEQEDTFTCVNGNCGKSFSVSENTIGDKVVCPHCDGRYNIK